MSRILLRQSHTRVQATSRPLLRRFPLFLSLPFHVGFVATNLYPLGLDACKAFWPRKLPYVNTHPSALHHSQPFSRLVGVGGVGVWKERPPSLPTLWERSGYRWRHFRLLPSDLTKAAKENRKLHGAYRKEVKKEVKTRLEKDSDYRPDRFPQTRDYFDRDTPWSWYIMYCDESPGQLAVHKKYRLGKCASVLSPLTVLFTGSPSVARLHKNDCGNWKTK